MITVLAHFKCPRCKTDFLSYLSGHYIFTCHTDGICFYDNDIGEVHNNHVLHPIRDKRECRKCRKHYDLLEFGIHE